MKIQSIISKRKKQVELILTGFIAQSDDYTQEVTIRLNYEGLPGSLLVRRKEVI